MFSLPPPVPPATGNQPRIQAHIDLVLCRKEIEHSADSDTSFFSGCRPNEQQPSIEIEMQSIKLPSITQCPGADVLTIGSVGCRVCNADEHQKCLQTCARLALKFQLSVLGLAPQCPGTQEQTCTTVSRLRSNRVARAACLAAHLFSIGNFALPASSHSSE